MSSRKATRQRNVHSEEESETEQPSVTRQQQSDESDEDSQATGSSGEESAISEAPSQGVRREKRNKQRKRGKRESPAKQQAVGRPTNQVAKNPPQQQNIANKQNEGGGDTAKLRLDLNLDVEVGIKASVHGDVTLAILG